MSYLILEHVEAKQATAAEYLFVNFEDTIADIYALATSFVNKGNNIDIQAHSYL